MLRRAYHDSPMYLFVLVIFLETVCCARSSRPCYPSLTFEMLAIVDVNSLSEMVSPCLTPLSILIFSLSICKCSLLSSSKLSLCICLSEIICTHLLFLVFAMISILLWFGQISSGNLRTQRRVICCIRGTSLGILRDSICRPFSQILPVLKVDFHLISSLA